MGVPFTQKDSQVTRVAVECVREQLGHNFSRRSTVLSTMKIGLFERLQTKSKSKY